MSVKRAACQARIVRPFTNGGAARRGHRRRAVRGTCCVIYVCFLQTPDRHLEPARAYGPERARTHDGPEIA
jgi:hypothetical protein